MDAAISEFRTDRYYWLNEYRWRLFVQTGIPIEGQVVFEPGAGIGDQTSWLLNRGARKVITSEGREINLDVIRKRFSGDERVLTMLGDLENCLNNPGFQVQADLIFLWGVYYHINDSINDFPILRSLAKIAPIIALDYQVSLSGLDWLEEYNYDNVSTSISHSSWRQTPETVISGIRASFGYAYFPREQMDWEDPSTLVAPRRIIIGSKTPLDYPGLVEAI